jgi:hypothetical protein
MSLLVPIDLQGPFVPGTKTFTGLPTDPVVYLWTVEVAGAHRVIYIGETTQLTQRWSDHLWWTIGGRYKLFDVDKLRNGSIEVAYEYNGPERHLNELEDFLVRDVKTAVDNVRLLRFWYAKLDPVVFAKRPMRTTVESAIHVHLKDCPANKPSMITNGRLSKLSRNAVRVRLKLKVPDNYTIIGLDAGAEIEYGELEALPA